MYIILGKNGYIAEALEEAIQKYAWQIKYILLYYSYGNNNSITYELFFK